MSKFAKELRNVEFDEDDVKAMDELLGKFASYKKGNSLWLTRLFFRICSLHTYSGSCIAQITSHTGETDLCHRSSRFCANRIFIHHFVLTKC